MLESEVEDDDVYAVFRAIKKERQENRAQRRNEWEAKFKAGELPGWTRFSETHYRYDLNGKPLDYWPGKKKWQYGGKISSGDVFAFIHRHTKS